MRFAKSIKKRESWKNCESSGGSQKIQVLLIRLLESYKMKSYSKVEGFAKRIKSLHLLSPMCCLLLLLLFLSGLVAMRLWGFLTTCSELNTSPPSAPLPPPCPPLSGISWYFPMHLWRNPQDGCFWSNLNHWESRLSFF